MSRSERDKGARGELEVAAIFRAAGFDCDRTPNSGGLRIVGDLYGEAMPFHVEVKRQEVVRPWLWWGQASAESPAGAAPVVAFRRNFSEWLALCELEGFVALAADARKWRIAFAVQEDDENFRRLNLAGGRQDQRAVDRGREDSV